MRKILPAAALVLIAAFAAACSSTSKAASSSSDSDSKTLSAVVTEREYSGPTSRGTGTWFLSFEAQDGDKYVHYRFPVTQQQYFRYPEGSHVEIVVIGNDLHDIKPGKD